MLTCICAYLCVCVCVSLSPDHYIRVVGFNAEKQVQMASFIVHKPE